MQKTKVLYIAILAGLMMQNIFAAEGDLFRGYTTSGNDRYANGNVLMAGEVYALVWMKSGFDFMGFNLNGKLVDAANNDLVSFTRVENPAQPTSLIFLVDKTYADAHKDGTYRVIVLDTRRVDGTLAAFGRDEDGYARLCQVNGWGWAEVVAQKSGKMLKAAGSTASGCYSPDIASLMPKDFPRSVITGMETDDQGCVVLKVARTKDCSAYTAEFGESVENVETSTGTPEQGDELAEDIRINTGKKMVGTGFFSVKAVNPMTVLSVQE